MCKLQINKIKQCKGYPSAKGQKVTLIPKQAAEVLHDLYWHIPAWVLKQKEETRGKTLNSCSETSVASDPNNTEAVNFCQRKKKKATLILFKHSHCSNKKQGGLWNYLLEANYIPQARVMPLDRYIKHKYLHTLSLIIKDDSKVKQISKYMFTLFNSNHHHPVKPVALLSVRMICHHTWETA